LPDLGKVTCAVFEHIEAYRNRKRPAFPDRQPQPCEFESTFPVQLDEGMGEAAQFKCLRKRAASTWAAGSFPRGLGCGWPIPTPWRSVMNMSDIPTADIENLGAVVRQDMRQGDEDIAIETAIALMGRHGLDQETIGPENAAGVQTLIEAGYLLALQDTRRGGQPPA
jgi:hypothetical protein